MRLKWHHLADPESDYREYFVYTDEAPLQDSGHVKLNLKTGQALFFTKADASFSVEQMQEITDYMKRRED